VIVPVRIHDLDRMVAAQRIVLAVEAHTTNADLLSTHAELLQESVRQRLLDAAKWTAGEYARASAFQRPARQIFDTALAEADALVTPTTAIAAPLANEREVTIGSLEPVQSALTRLTGPTNFTGHPSLSMPCGQASTGAPIGIQLIGRYWDEAMLYRMAQALEDAGSPSAGRYDLQLPPDVNVSRIAAGA
jgi:aspartyl-tRNA(Asn)/glutamyl-tRNA(Gln) amidotransferase subunit A